MVVGVFIGLQVANWNDEIADRRNAEQMQERVLVDLENERIVIEASRLYWTTTRSYAESAVLGFLGDTSINAEQFVIRAYQASQAQFPLSNRAAYEQMVASGNVSISGSNELRMAIITYYVQNWSERPVNGTAAPYRANVRRVIPHSIQAAIREQCGDQITAMGQISALVLPESCDLDLPEELFSEAAAELRRHPGLLMDLRHHLSDLDAKLQNLDQLDRQLDDMFRLAGTETAQN